MDPRQCALATFAILAVALSLKQLWLRYLQGQERLKSQGFVTAEDVELWGGRVCPDSPTQRHRRAAGVLRNDQENHVSFLALALAYLGLAANSWWAMMPATIVLCVYIAARWVHAVAYMKGLQPLRMRAFGVGALCEALAIFGVLAALLFWAKWGAS